ncbi:hypothetical protein AVEN_216518-1 [Araneus ventricosus]|uniref:Uncharacterized protein n=1 Tax=Araneus ventricosus TaxID=182803 RepID=A0A4Y2EUA3_ARAVE|nr:hypothetical protein AVEN_216518-1 [Araneus ventricosus]
MSGISKAYCKRIKKYCLQSEKTNDGAWNFPDSVSKLALRDPLMRGLQEGRRLGTAALRNLEARNGPIALLHFVLVRTFALLCIVVCIFSRPALLIRCVCLLLRSRLPSSRLDSTEYPLCM